MKAVGVKDLKARLSEHLRAVRAGETYLITDRAEVIAELRPPTRRGSAATTVDDVLDGLAEQGDIARARVPKSAWHWKPAGLGLSAREARAIIDDIRGERDES